MNNNNNATAPSYPSVAGRACQYMLHLTVASRWLMTNTPQVERMVPNTSELIAFRINHNKYLRSSLKPLLSSLSLSSPASFPSVFINPLCFSLLPNIVSKYLKQTSLFCLIMIAFHSRPSNSYTEWPPSHQRGR